jgi:hypothetical protein
MDFGEHEIPVKVGNHFQMTPLVEIGYGSVMLAVPRKKEVPMAETVRIVEVPGPTINVIDAETAKQILDQIGILQQSVARIEAIISRPDPEAWWKRVLNYLKRRFHVRSN